MEDKKKPLYLYEALELRSEYDARIKTLKDCLPESKQNRSRFSFSQEDGKYRASSDYDLASARMDLRKIELKRRKLNGSIQRANFNHCIDFNGEAVNLSEALETRKALNEQIGEFHNQVVSSSCQKVIVIAIPALLSTSIRYPLKPGCFFAAGMVASRARLMASSSR